MDAFSIAFYTWLFIAIVFLVISLIVIIRLLKQSIRRIRENPSEISKIIFFFVNLRSLLFFCAIVYLSFNFLLLLEYSYSYDFYSVFGYFVWSVCLTIVTYFPFKFMIQNINGHNKIWWILGLLIISGGGNLFLPEMYILFSAKCANIIYDLLCPPAIFFTFSAIWLIKALLGRYKCNRSKMNLIVLIIVSAIFVTYISIYVDCALIAYQNHFSGDNYNIRGQYWAGEEYRHKHIEAYRGIPRDIVFFCGFIIPTSINCILAHFLAPKKNKNIDTSTNTVECSNVLITKTEDKHTTKTKKIIKIILIILGILAFIIGVCILCLPMMVLRFPGGY